MAVTCVSAQAPQGCREGLTGQQLGCAAGESWFDVITGKQPQTNPWDVGSK